MFLTIFKLIDILGVEITLNQMVHFVIFRDLSPSAANKNHKQK